MQVIIITNLIYSQWPVLRITEKCGFDRPSGKNAILEFEFCFGECCMRRGFKIPILFLFLACFVFFVPQDGQSRKVEKYYHLKPSQIVEHIQRKAGRRAVFIYASWCGFCRAVMPSFIAMEQSNPGSVIAISIDQDPERLISYMNQYANLPFHLIVWDRTENLGTQLGRLGIKPSNAIPFVALLDEKSKVVRQGHLKAADVAAFLTGPQKL